MFFRSCTHIVIVSLFHETESYRFTDSKTRILCCKILTRETVLFCTAPAFEQNDSCTVESADADSATVSWPAPSAAQFYYIYIAPDKLFNSTLHFYTVTGLNPITDYTFTVAVYGVDGAAGNTIECRGKTGLYLRLTFTNLDGLL